MGSIKWVEAVPPEHFNGSTEKWKEELKSSGYWNGHNPKNYSDVTVPPSVWWKMLIKTEES